MKGDSIRPFNFFSESETNGYKETHLKHNLVISSCVSCNDFIQTSAMSLIISTVHTSSLRNINDMLKMGGIPLQFFNESESKIQLQTREEAMEIRMDVAH